MLLQRFADLADKNGLESYLEATVAGYPLYKKVGFEVVELAAVDLVKWGDPVHKPYLMVRKPRQRATDETMDKVP